MTRTLNMSAPPARVRISLQRLRRVEPAVIERAAGDGAGELLRTRRQQRA